jgi:hypothetical protein
MVSTSPNPRPGQSQTSRARETFLMQFETEDERRAYMRSLSQRAREKLRHQQRAAELLMTLTNPHTRLALRQRVAGLDDIARNPATTTDNTDG